MKTRELRYAGRPSRSDCGVLKGRHRLSVARLAGYSPYLDCRTDGEASAKREISDFPVPNQRGLQDLFDLTAAEAKLAQLLACGDSIDDVAQKLDIKMSTARTQLAAVLLEDRHAAPGKACRPSRPHCSSGKTGQAGGARGLTVRPLRKTP